MLSAYYHKDFKKQFKKLPKEIHAKVAEKITIFLKNPSSSSLHNHPLKGEWEGYQSINITGDIRAIYKLKGTVAIFVAIGTHSELYQ